MKLGILKIGETFELNDERYELLGKEKDYCNVRCITGYNMEKGLYVIGNEIGVRVVHPFPDDYFGDE